MPALKIADTVCNESLRVQKLCNEKRDSKNRNVQEINYFLRSKTAGYCYRENITDVMVKPTVNSVPCHMLCVPCEMNEISVCINNDADSSYSPDCHNTGLIESKDVNGKINNGLNCERGPIKRYFQDRHCTCHGNCYTTSKLNKSCCSTEVKRSCCEVKSSANRRLPDRNAQKIDKNCTGDSFNENSLDDLDVMSNDDNCFTNDTNIKQRNVEHKYTRTYDHNSYLTNSSISNSYADNKNCLCEHPEEVAESKNFSSGTGFPIKTKESALTNGCTSSLPCNDNNDMKPSIDSDSHFRSLSTNNVYNDNNEQSNTCKDIQQSMDILNMSFSRTNSHHPGLRLSLFPKVPPFILFGMHDVKGEGFPAAVQKLLRWKLSTITPLVVRKTVQNSGFRLLKKSVEWGGTWGKHIKSVCFKTIYDYQKLNHFPGTFHLGRKDRLWRNIRRLMTKYGVQEFGFMPDTYILPQDIKLLRLHWENEGSNKQRWIVKPPASARGTGIKVIHKWCQIPRKSPVIVQKYVANPYLINDTKFDLRLYVLLTSVNPLRIYLYENGLVRFASAKYSTELNTLNDRYMHLTNYSINKLSTEYTHNEDAQSCHGHKWTLKTLWGYLEERNVNVNKLWNDLVDLVIKTMLSAEGSINILASKNLNSRYNSYELFGIDVLFDQDLKPWLLEVNISPSLHSSSPLDLAVKGPLVHDILNIAGFHIPRSKKLSENQLKKGLGTVPSPLCYDSRIYTLAASTSEKEKHDLFTDYENRDEYLDAILENLTPSDVRRLIQYEDELTQLGSFKRIFPTVDTHKYFQYFDSARYYDQLFDAWETKHGRCRNEGIDVLRQKCEEGIHLDVSLVNRSYKICKTHQKSRSTRAVPAGRKRPHPVNGSSCTHVKPVHALENGSSDVKTDVVVTESTPVSTKTAQFKMHTPCKLRAHRYSPTKPSS